MSAQRRRPARILEHLFWLPARVRSLALDLSAELAVDPWPADAAPDLDPWRASAPWWRVGRKARLLDPHQLLSVCIGLAILGVAAGTRIELDAHRRAAAAPAVATPDAPRGLDTRFAPGDRKPPDLAMPEAAMAGAMPEAALAEAPAPAVPVTPAPVERTIPARSGALPTGKGMWIWLAEKAEGGNAEAIVARAKAVGLSHLYVRTGTLKEGFMGADLLDRLLPVAHAAGLRVYAWDFPYLDDVDGDVRRALAAIRHLTPDGHRVDGYVADVELPSMGVNITPATGGHFGSALRGAVGPHYPLIVSVPRPSPALAAYPYKELVRDFSAIAPMVYWLNRSPVIDMAGVMRDLGGLGKPIIPVGQAYDGAGEGGPAGVPSRQQLIDFMRTADELGATGVSFWSWQHADQQAWDAIREAGEFRLPAGDPATFGPGQIRAYQTLLTSLGFPAAADGAWGPATDAAVRAYQEAARLPVTGLIDEATRDVLLTPFAPPLP